MAAMEWEASLEQGLARMDDTHREFVTVYNALAAAGPSDFVGALDAFILHTVEHFGQENRWMEKVGFPACHKSEHDRVLEVLQQIRSECAGGDFAFARQLVEELPVWFRNHANTMDAALAFHLREVGFDVEREVFVEGQARAGAGAACATLAESISESSNERCDH